MKKSTYLILGSCLILQAVPFQGARGSSGFFGGVIGSFTGGATREARAASANIPRYHHTQVKELLGLEGVFADEIADRSTDLALYIHRRTRDLLPADWREDSNTVAEALIETANRYEMDPLFLMAVIKHESRFKPEAIGSHGEIGLMQIKPSTALWLLEEEMISPNLTGEQSLDSIREALKDPETNIAFGAAYLAQLRNTFKGRGRLYLSAYNMGAVNLKTRLRNGQRPRIYSDHILAQYIALTNDFASQLVVSGGEPTRTIASLTRTLDLH